MTFVTNPAFGIWDMDSIGSALSPGERGGLPHRRRDTDGFWCKACRENGVFSWTYDFENGKECLVCGSTAVPYDIKDTSVKSTKIKVNITRY